MTIAEHSVDYALEIEERHLIRRIAPPAKIRQAPPQVRINPNRSTVEAPQRLTQTLQLNPLFEIEAGRTRRQQQAGDVPTLAADRTQLRRRGPQIPSQHHLMGNLSMRTFPSSRPRTNHRKRTTHRSRPRGKDADATKPSATYVSSRDLGQLPHNPSQPRRPPSPDPHAALDDSRPHQRDRRNLSRRRNPILAIAQDNRRQRILNRKQIRACPDRLRQSTQTILRPLNRRRPSRPCLETHAQPTQMIPSRS
ncbi:hypothetical protein GCM10010522_32040 [Kribbella solani]